MQEKLFLKRERKIPIPIPRLGQLSESQSIHIWDNEIICPAKDWMFASPHSSPDSCWNPIPNVMVFGSGAFGKVIGSWGQKSHEWDSCPYKIDLRELPCPFCHVRTEQGDGSLCYLIPNLLAPWLLTSQPPELQEINLFISYLVHGIWSQQPEWSKTYTKNYGSRRFQKTVWLKWWSHFYFSTWQNTP